MTVTELGLPGVLLVETRVFRDDRGHFLETWNEARYREAGIAGPFVQDNVSHSRHGVLRGLHLQDPRPQGKLVGVLEGAVWDVAVDVRPGSATFGQWAAAELSAGNARQLWVPPGFAHGFVVTSEHALVLYKCTDVYVPTAEVSLRWDDPDLAIPWPVAAPLLSPKDAAALSLRELAARQGAARERA